MKYGTDRFKPEGDWSQATPLINVAGVSFRKSNCLNWARNVRKAEKRSLRYGVSAESEPTNHHDSNAIKVIGYCERKKFFGKIEICSWHLGYVPSEWAEIITKVLLNHNYQITAELYSIYEGGDDFLEIRFFVLGPIGVKKILKQWDAIAVV